MLLEVQHAEAVVVAAQDLSDKSDALQQEEANKQKGPSKSSATDKSSSPEGEQVRLGVTLNRT